MKILAWIITSINVMFGLNAFLNAVGLLRSSKYGQGATWFVALLFLGLGAYSIFGLVTDNNTKQALWLSLSPSLVAVVVMFFTLIMGRWQ